MMNKKSKTMLLQLCAVVLMFAPVAKAEILVFTDQTEFEIAAMMTGADFVGVEDFENNNISDGLLIGNFGVDSVLEAGTPLLNAEGLGFENGLASPLIQLFAEGTPDNDLVFAGATSAIGTDMTGAVLAAPSDSMGPLDFLGVLNIRIDSDTATATGFDLFSSDSLSGNNGDYNLEVLDNDGVSLLTSQILDLGFEGFVGIVATEGESIQTIKIDNQHGFSFGGELVDNVQVWKPVSFLLGDVNRDMVVDLLDVRPFVNLLVNNAFQVEADINMDSVVDLLDVAPFVEILSAGG